jgi:hypothetical protein
MLPDCLAFQARVAAISSARDELAGRLPAAVHDTYACVADWGYRVPAQDQVCARMLACVGAHTRS